MVYTVDEIEKLVRRISELVKINCDINSFIGEHELRHEGFSNKYKWCLMETGTGYKVLGLNRVADIIDEATIGAVKFKFKEQKKYNVVITERGCVSA